MPISCLDIPASVTNRNIVNDVGDSEMAKGEHFLQSSLSKGEGWSSFPGFSQRLGGSQ